MSAHTDSASAATSASAAPSPAPVDPRGLRFGAGVTTVVLAAVLVLSGMSVGAWLLAVQAVVFALGVALGPGRSPYGLVFRALVRPRIGAPTEVEDARPPRFAQAVGLAFTVVGLGGVVAGSTVVLVIAAGLALVAALLNATIGLCLGCELYLILRRLTPAKA